MKKLSSILILVVSVCLLFSGGGVVASSIDITRDLVALSVDDPRAHDFWPRHDLQWRPASVA